METFTPQAAAPRVLAPGAPQSRGQPRAGDDRLLADVIERLVETAPGLQALRKHHLHLAAARIWRSHGREIPTDLRSDVRAAALQAMLARFILGKARAAYGGALMLMKGPEVAAHYPIPSDRPFRDLDLLADDPESVQRALIGAGFVEYGEPAAYMGLQHLPPLMWPGVPLVVEVHRRPSQPFWLDPVPVDSLFRIAVPSATGVAGILAPEPAAHAVLVVAHAWNHDPLGCVGQLIDVAALLASVDHERAGAFARAWGWEGMWNTTLAVMDSVLGGKSRTLALKLWARHLLDVRERVVLEDHISRLAAPVWSLPAGEVPQAVACVLYDSVAPATDEGWATQVRRSCLAIAHAFRPGSDHEKTLAWIGPRTKPARPRSKRVRAAVAADGTEISVVGHSEDR